MGHGSCQGYIVDPRELCGSGGQPPIVLRRRIIFGLCTVNDPSHHLTVGADLISLGKLSQKIIDHMERLSGGVFCRLNPSPNRALDIRSNPSLGLPRHDFYHDVFVGARNVTQRRPRDIYP